jgi:hypothetical protein
VIVPKNKKNPLKSLKINKKINERGRKCAVMPK